MWILGWQDGKRGYYLHGTGYDGCTYGKRACVQAVNRQCMEIIKEIVEAY